ncbi:hypothetical protein FOZ62_023755 [Perkinsus olseni]|uniref:Uncharacterized protein n=2 Tax=Perkinsus olseni TaxID=32597 RepID=A0A7J6RAZ7_PEROL|nr:hypothetical protein FOZ62_023755 [Perkinsus olseni]
MKFFSSAALATSVLSTLAFARTRLPKDDKRSWQSKIKSELKGFSWGIYANGRGRLDKPGKFKCSGKWKDAVAYGARKKEIKEFCVRLHEKQQDDWGYKDSPKKYSCILDPNDKGNDHGRKNRDWLCYEKTPKSVLLPPHGPPLDSECPAGDHLVPRCMAGIAWYPDESPPAWCTYNWYSDYQTCWCMPGFYRTSPYDTSLKMRVCPEETVMIIPRQLSLDKWNEMKYPTTSTTTTTTATMNTTAATTSTSTTTTVTRTTEIITTVKPTIAADTTMMRSTRTTTASSAPTTSGSATLSDRCICPSPTTQQFSQVSTAERTSSSSFVSTTIVPTMAAEDSERDADPIETSDVNIPTDFTEALEEDADPRVGAPTAPLNISACGEHGVWSSVNQSCVCHGGWETVGSDPCSALISAVPDGDDGMGEMASTGSDSDGNGGLILAIVLMVIIIGVACYFL